jgi:predicted enzyme related to lactoylglutathione lyase
MPSGRSDLRIGSVVLNCQDFDRTLAFWQEALHYAPRDPDEREFTVLRDPTGRGPSVSVQETPNLKFGRNRMHLDLYTTDQHGEVERLLQLGATIHQPAREGEDYVILADPEGKLFCVVQLPAAPESPTDEK